MSLLIFGVCLWLCCYLCTALATQLGPNKAAASTPRLKYCAISLRVAKPSLLVPRWLKAWSNATEENEQMCCFSWFCGVLVTRPWSKQSSSSGENKAGNLSSDYFGDEKKLLWQQRYNRWWQWMLVCERELCLVEFASERWRGNSTHKQQRGAATRKVLKSWMLIWAKIRTVQGVGQDKFCFKFFWNKCNCSD